MMRDDQMFDLRADDVGKLWNRRHRGAHHHRAERDVADEISVARVARRSVVVELFELSDIVQQRAGGQQILIGAIRGAERQRRSGDRQNVLEKPAAVGVVHGQRRRPDRSLSACCAVTRCSSSRTCGSRTC